MFKRFNYVFLVVAMSLCAMPAIFSQSFTCNDQINVTVNHSCAIDITVDAFIEGDTQVTEDIMNGLYTYEIYNANGVIVEGGINGPTSGGDDLSAYVNSLLFYRIKYQGLTNTCGGTILIEDKNAPTIDCQTCPEINGTTAADYAPECVRNCYEQEILQLRYDDGLRDDIVQEDFEDFVDDAMSDNCNNWDMSLVSHVDDWKSLGACAGSRLKRTWKVGYVNYDGSIGYVSCTREYFFKPFDLNEITEYTLDANDNPIIEPIRDSLVLPVAILEIPCGSDVSPAGIADYFDNALTTDRDTDDNNIDPDELDVDRVIESNEGIPYGFPHFYQDGVGSGGPHPQPVDSEVCNLITGYSDSEVPVCALGCAGNRKILRNWTILDWCTGEFIMYQQIIKAIDVDGPNLDVPDVIASVDPWECAANVPLPHPEHIYDGCDSDLTYNIGYAGGMTVGGDVNAGYILIDAPVGIHTVEYVSTDCCGNTGRRTITVEVQDNTPPVAVSKEFVVTSLTNIGNEITGYQGFAKIYAQDIDNGSYDGCSAVTLEVRRDPNCDEDDAEWGPFVTFCCEDLIGFAVKEIDVELRITDANGNANHVWSTVRLEDKSASFPTIPPHMYLTCDMDVNDFSITGGLPRIYGACGEGVVECDTLEVIENTEPRELRASDGVIIDGNGPIVAPAYDPSCGYGAIRRQFRDCGGGTQWFVILPVDPFDDSTIQWPDDINVDCNAYESTEPTWLDATCNLIGVSLDSDTFQFEDGSCLKILNRWSLINWCVYDPSNPNSPGLYEHVQVVKIVDTEDPELMVVDSLCFAVNNECLSQGVSLTGTAVDNGECSSDWIRYEISIDAYADWTEDFNYSSTNPRTLPNGEPNPYYIPKVANGEPVTITLPDGIPASNVWHRAVWRVFDGCNNSTSVTRYFQISDKKAPTPYCINLSTAVMSNGEVELWAIDFDQGSFDNCTPSENLLFTFTDVLPPPRDDREYDSNDDLVWYNGTYWYYDSTTGDYEDRDSYGGDIHRWEPGLRSAGKVFTIADADANGFVTIPIYVWDGEANIDFCQVNLRLIDNGGGGMAMVSGQIKTEYGEAVQGIMTEINGPVNYFNNNITNAQGQYAYADTPFNADYRISGYKNDDYLNGVSTLDLVLMQRHILGQQALDSPYKMIAADINNDGNISAVDLLELRKLILGIYDEFPSNGSWKIVDAKDELTVANPWGYNQHISIQDLTQDMMDEDFIAVKIGDINESVELGFSSTDIGDRKSAPVKLNFTDQTFRKGEIVELSLTTDRTDLFGLQFTLNVEDLELIDVTGQNANMSNVAVIGDQLTVSLFDQQAYDASQAIVNFKFKAGSQAGMQDLIAINSDITKAEAYTGKSLNVNGLILNARNKTSQFALYQNEPNPFNEMTSIRFELPEDMPATIQLFDVNGRLIHVINQSFNTGLNTVNLNAANIPTNGMIYYKLQAGEFSDVKHMILIK